MWLSSTISKMTLLYFQEQVVDETSLNSLGIIPISDYIRIEWIIREGSETQNAFDRCEGFHIDKDDIYALSKAA